MSFPPVKYDTFALQGGVDEVTPTLQLTPGICRRASNFEASISGGYSRIAGYERYDGHDRPSNGTCIVLTCVLTGSVAVGNTVTGSVSLATGKVIALNGSDVVITRLTGGFSTNDNLLVAAVSQGTITGISGSVADGLTGSQYDNLAADEYRASIAAVPGSSSILGLVYYNSALYAFRNNAGATAAAMYKSSASGWTLINFGEEISFSNANTSVGVGDVLTQGGATATIVRVIVQTGTLLSGTNTGRLILSGRAGGAFSAGSATSTGAGALTLSGAQSAITLLPNGRFRCVVGGFGASSSSKCVYGADGVNRAFEFDGTHLVPISTGMTDDTPDLIAIHKQHLFLTFGYSLQFSGSGDPFTWSVVVGAGEIGMTDTITNILPLPGDQTSGALVVFTRRDTSVLYGTSSTTFALSTFNTGAGAVLDSSQNLEQSYMLGDYGVMSLETTKNFGNFASSSLTMTVRPFLRDRINLTTASGINRAKGQYRVFFSDGTGLYLTMKNGQFVGVMPVEYVNPVACMCEGDNQLGLSTSYFGSTNGMVYEMDLGTSFDGDDISATLEMVFNATHSHRLLKRYRKASLEVNSNDYFAFDVGYALGYAAPDVSQSAAVSYSQFLRSSYWDSFVWDSFVWDGNSILPSEVDLTGSAVNISFRISLQSDLVQPFTINTITTHYTPRRGIR